MVCLRLGGKKNGRPPKRSPELEGRNDDGSTRRECRRPGHRAPRLERRRRVPGFRLRRVPEGHAQGRFRGEVREAVYRIDRAALGTADGVLVLGEFADGMTVDADLGEQITAGRMVEGCIWMEHDGNSFAVACPASARKLLSLRPAGHSPGRRWPLPLRSGGRPADCCQPFPNPPLDRCQPVRASHPAITAIFGSTSAGVDRAPIPA